MCPPSGKPEMEDEIVAVGAQQLIDCKCRPMVEVVIETASGGSGRGCAPTGSSVGMHEAFILRDGDPANYDGLSVHKAVETARHVIGPALAGMNVFDQRAIDMKMIELDGTANSTTARSPQRRLAATCPAPARREDARARTAGARSSRAELVNRDTSRPWPAPPTVDGPSTVARPAYR